MSIDHDESRRKFLSRPVKVLPVVALASTGLGAVTTVAAQTAVANAVKLYTPTYFQEEEWRFIQAAVDILIPQDDLGPGAIVAGVPEFIDRQMETPYGHGRLWYMQGPFHPEMMRTKPDLGYQLNMNPRDIYRSGISELNVWCNQTHNKAFADLDKDTQVQVIKDLEGNKIVFADDAVLASTFWGQLLSNTKEGFLPTPFMGGIKIWWAGKWLVFRVHAQILWTGLTIPMNPIRLVLCQFQVKRLKSWQLQKKKLKLCW